MAQRDNWGDRTRIGMFIVSSEAVPEAECWAMCPTGVSIHAARVAARAPWAQWTTDGRHVELAPDLERGAKQFAAMQLGAVVIGHSSSSLAGGIGWDDAVVRQLTDLVAPSTHVTTNGLDCQAALRASNLKKPFLVFPTWFGESIMEKGVAYFGDHGFAPSGHMRFDPGPKWRDVPPGELYPRGMGFDQDIEALRQQVMTACPADADGVLIAGTGFRCIGIIDDLESALGRPVITANQASVWHCLRMCGVADAIPNYGRLLTL